MNWKITSKSSSLSTSLIRLVFIVYVSMTIIITLSQLAIEYYHTKGSIQDEMTQLEDIFEKGLADALFRVDYIGLRGIVEGIYKIPLVKGVLVKDDLGGQVQQIGYVKDEKENIVFVNDSGSIIDKSSSSFIPNFGMFSHSFSIDYTYIGNEKVGQLIIYSGASAILDRISFGFIFITVNSFILILVLWAIIYHFTNQMIGKPLRILTQTTRKLNPKNPDFKTISYSDEERTLLDAPNELGVLSRSFDKMRIGILERIGNLQEIRDLGVDFSSSYNFDNSFKRIMQILDNKFSFHRGQLFLENTHTILKAASYDAKKEEDDQLFSEAITKHLIQLGKSEKIQSIPLKTLISDLGNENINSSLLVIPLVDENRYLGAMAFFQSHYPFTLDDESQVFLQALARLTVINFKKINMLEVVRENTRLSEEMKLARHIQTVLLPENPKLNGYEIAASLTPADEVGGDYYDIISVDGYDWLVIGDVAGHGVSAGLIMMMVQTAIHTVLLDNPSVNPAHLLSVINQIIFQNIERMYESKHMTITVLAAGKNGKFAFSGLHEEIFVYRSETSEVEEIETDGMWIGLEPDISHLLKTEQLFLNTGDCMVLYTDGITEAMKAGGVLYGCQKMIDIIKENGKKTAFDIHQAIIHSLKGWDKDDDVTLLVVKKIT